MSATDRPGEPDDRGGEDAARGMSALPEIVANTATDLTRVGGLLTEVVGVGADEVRCEADLPRIHLDWPGGSALLTVTGSGAGASWVTLRLTPGNGDDTAHRLLDGLADRVDENFTTG
ncbi:hypothetical protein ACWEOE_26560 [Amycolatopsis sp. NPDC004368]